MHFNIILPSTPRSSKWSVAAFPTKSLYVYPLSPIMSTCPESNGVMNSHLVPEVSGSTVGPDIFF